MSKLQSEMRLSDVCWALTPGEPGMRSQALGLAEAVGLPIVEKRSFVRAPWSWLPGGLLPTPLRALDPAGGSLAPPWPRLLVCCGRRSIGPALAVKRLSGGRTIAAYIQNPEHGRTGFDLVVALPHDGVSGWNVMTINTALHRVTPQALSEARTKWRGQLAENDSPLLGVLLGGDNPAYRLTDAVISQLAAVLREAHQEHGYRAYITPSRRTGDRAKTLLADALAGQEWARVWDETGENPYLGILALSERLIVTGESISMISEALAVGRPVHVLRLEGQGRRHEAFLSRILGERAVSAIKGNTLDWSFAGTRPLNATEAAAARLRQLLAERDQQI